MFQEAWRAIIGLIFVLVVLFLPRGLAGLARDAVDRLPLGGARRADDAPAGAPREAAE
jgi:urea transport system permease protein